MSDSMRSDAFADAREYGFTLGYAKAQADRDKIGRTGKAAMSDLAARLRLCGNDSSSDFFETCADEIDRLRLALAQAERALQEAQSQYLALTEVQREANQRVRWNTLEEVEAIADELHRHGGWSNSGDDAAKAHSQGYKDSAVYLRDKLRALRGATPPPVQVNCLESTLHGTAHVFPANSVHCYCHQVRLQPPATAVQSGGAMPTPSQEPT